VLELYRKALDAYASLGTAAKAGLIIGIALVTTAFAMAVVVWLPQDHFRAKTDGEGRPSRHPLLRWTLTIFRNVLGILILPLGVVMALPLVPGPGLVFIVIGLSLIDFPGKKALERRLLARPGVRKFLNDLRANFGKPPLVLD
jgi:hypothetical protein